MIFCLYYVVGEFQGQCVVKAKTNLVHGFDAIYVWGFDIVHCSFLSKIGHTIPLFCWSIIKRIFLIMDYKLVGSVYFTIT